MRRVILLIVCIAVFLCACSSRAHQNLRQFCEAFSQNAKKTDYLAQIDPEQFTARPVGEGLEYQAYLGNMQLLACTALRDGRVHTVL